MQRKEEVTAEYGTVSRKRSLDPNQKDLATSTQATVPRKQRF